MCLVVQKNTEKTITTKEMYVYKILRRYSYDVYGAPKNDFIYEKDVLYQTEIKRSYDDISIYDRLAYHSISQQLKSLGVYSYSKQYQFLILNTFDIYSEGFHFAITYDRLEIVSYSDILARFIIPVGSEVIYDESGLGVTNQIIFSTIL